MINAKQELLIELKQKPKVKCAKITTGQYWRNTDPDTPKYLLKVDHTKEDYMTFLESLDFSYDNGYGGQNLYGMVWFQDGSWLERYEYDGTEWWGHRTLPDIPKELYV